MSEDQLSRAMLLCLERAKLVVEPAGVAAVAAIMAPTRSCSPRRWSRCCPAATSTRWCCCTSPSTGWSPRGRFLSLRMEIIDRPGSLAALLALVGELGGNVVDVEHSRVGSSLPLGDVEVALRLETRGAAHCEEIVAALTAAGFRVIERR